jgi:hypothetical protein
LEEKRIGKDRAFQSKLPFLSLCARYLVVSYTEIIAELPRLTLEQRRELAAQALGSLEPAPLMGRSEEIEREERNARLRALAGSLSAEEANSWAQAIEDGCERIDPRDW